MTEAAKQEEVKKHDIEESIEELFLEVPKEPENIDVPAKILSTPSKSPLDDLHLLLRNDLFLGLLVLTLLNAIVFIHYARTESPSISIRSANQAVQSGLRSDFDFIGTVQDFLNFHGDFSSVSSPEFSAALSRLRGRLGKFGIDSEDTFFKEQFVARNGGIHWTQPEVREPTLYQPSIK